VKVTHQFQVRALCPVDGSEDAYEAEFTTNSIVPVETLLAAAAKFSGQVIFQEELTRQLFNEFHTVWRVGGRLATVGTHSGVVTTVTVGAD
jgi:hypothetical protein